jgi:hypothetical protein
VAIYNPDDDGFVISSHGVWMPGVYATRRAANYAFRFTDETLNKLQARANAERRFISFEDLQAARSEDTELKSKFQMRSGKWLTL